MSTSVPGYPSKWERALAPESGAWTNRVLTASASVHGRDTIFQPRVSPTWNSPGPAPGLGCSSDPAATRQGIHYYNPNLESSK